jgi:hypothetical protein
MIDALLAAGGTAEQLAALMKASMADDEARREAKRANNAERQRRFRERHKDENNADNALGDVTECDSVTTPALSLSPNENNSNPHTHTHPENTPRARKADDFPCPVWCEPEVWADLKRNRRTKKLTNTVTAYRQFVADVEAMADDAWPPGKLVKAIVAKGWGGAHDPRDDRKPGNGNGLRDSIAARPDKRSGLARAIDGELGALSPFP